MLECEQHVLYVFPGQGSQYPGMGSDLYQEFDVARQVYVQASDVLGQDIAELSFTDPEEQLNLTRFTQPALLTHSIACLEVFRDLTDDRLRPAITAGHSLGEYSALVAAKALSFENGLKLVQKRGELMGAHGEGEMSAFRDLDVETLQPIAERFRCAVAGCNLPEQTVIGGRGEDLTLVEHEVKEQQLSKKRPTRLKTEGAFHTFYMEKAAQLFQPVLDAASFDSPETGVLSNYTGGYHESAVDIRERLFLQLFNPVLWHANLLTALGDGIKVIVEFGGGIGKASEPEGKRPNLEGMIKKALQVANHEALYLAAINLQSLRKTAGFVRGIGNLMQEPHDDMPNSSGLGIKGTAVDENWFHLFVPTNNGVVTENTARTISQISELGLCSIVQIVQQSGDENLECLEHLVGEKCDTPTPYLEKVIGCETGAVLYYVGQEMDVELAELRHRLQPPGYGFREQP